MTSIEKRLAAIEARNRKVENDKAWEVSTTRRLSIVTITYATASLLLYGMMVPDWYLGAVVPVCGYVISTLSLPIIRKWWQN